MKFLEKVNQLAKWNCQGKLTQEHYKKFNNIFDCVDETKAMLAEIKDKKEKTQQYLEFLNQKEKEQNERLKNIFIHFEYAFNSLSKEIEEREKRVENTCRERITKDEYLKELFELFNQWQ